MAKAKIFDGQTHGRVVKIKFELDFFIDRSKGEDITIEQAKLLVRQYSRIDLGDKILRGLKDAEVVI